MEQLLERSVKVDEGFKLNISEEVCDERVSRLLTDIRETLDKRLQSEREDDDDDVVIVGEEWNVDPLGDAGPAEERPKGEIVFVVGHIVTLFTFNYRRSKSIQPGTARKCFLWLQAPSTLLRRLWHRDPELRS